MSSDLIFSSHHSTTSWSVRRHEQRILRTVVHPSRDKKKPCSNTSSYSFQSSNWFNVFLFEVTVSGIDPSFPPLRPSALVWWSRRSENNPQNCDIELENDNPSLEAKICGNRKVLTKTLTLCSSSAGYCFARCQQQFAACLLAQMNEVVGGSLDFCQVKSNSCQKHCFEDKRTSQNAEANWGRVVKVLRQFNTYPTSDDEKKN